MWNDNTTISPPPFVEVELVYETAGPNMDTSAWRAFEIVTKNRIYSCDWSMICIEVRDRRSGEIDPKNGILGARLSGGQKAIDQGMEVCYPCPRPGYEAVFQSLDGRGMVTTSTVQRVMLRLRVLTAPTAHLKPMWDDLSGS